MKLRIALIVTGIVAALAPVGAHAGHCASNVIIFSGISGAPKANSNAAACTADPAHETPYDGRIINPASNEIVVRYNIDLGESTPTLTAVVNGLGFSNQEVTLTRVQHTTGPWIYNSANLALDPSLSGCITATVQLDEPESNTFHTVGALC